MKKAPQVHGPRFDSDGYMAITKAKDGDFENKVPGRWKIERVRFRSRTHPYAFFTCPYCAGINQASVGLERDEYEGIFFCIYCKPCGRNLSIHLKGFSPEWEKADN